MNLKLFVNRIIYLAFPIAVLFLFVFLIIVYLSNNIGYSASISVGAVGCLITAKQLIDVSIWSLIGKHRIVSKISNRERNMSREIADDYMRVRNVFNNVDNFVTAEVVEENGFIVDRMHIEIDRKISTYVGQRLKIYELYKNQDNGENNKRHIFTGFVYNCEDNKIEIPRRKKSKVKELESNKNRSIMVQIHNMSSFDDVLYNRSVEYNRIVENISSIDTFRDLPKVECENFEHKKTILSRIEQEERSGNLNPISTIDDLVKESQILNELNDTGLEYIETSTESYFETSRTISDMSSRIKTRQRQISKIGTKEFVEVVSGERRFGIFDNRTDERIGVCEFKNQERSTIHQHSKLKFKVVNKSYDYKDLESEIVLKVQDTDDSMKGSLIRT